MNGIKGARPIAVIPTRGAHVNAWVWHRLLETLRPHRVSDIFRWRSFRAETNQALRPSAVRVPADAARPLPDGAKVDDADSPFEKPARRPSPTGGRPPPENHLPAGSLPEGSRRRDGRIFDPWTRSGWSGNAPRPGLRGAEGFLLGKTTRMMDQMRNEQRGEACRGDGEERPERRKLNRVLPASASNLPVRARYFRRRVGEAG